MYLYISDILLYKSPNPAYSGEFLHINLKDPLQLQKYDRKRAQQNTPKGQFGPAGHVMDNTTLINGIIVDYERVTN